MNRHFNGVTFSFIAGTLFSVKTYIIYRFFLHLNVDNVLQEFILFMNPFMTTFIFITAIVLLVKPRLRIRFILWAILIGSLVIYFNLVFYRSFTDFITIPQLFQTSNFSDLSTSILSLVKWYDVLLFLDVFIVLYISKKTITFAHIFSKRKKVFLIMLSFVLLTFNLFLAEIARPQLLERAFDREYLVKNIGLFYYHLYDVGLQSKMRVQKVTADSTDLEKIKAYITNDVRSEEQSALYGIGEERNIIFISAESLQTFVINEQLHGEEITPFLNRLIEDESTYYFDNFYHQTKQGKTSDSEFIVENSLYGLPSGAVFYTHAQNEYYSLSKILNENGYESSVFHANTETFYNRNLMYESLGVNQFFDEESYAITDENKIGWGLKDKPFFAQSMPLLKELERPFYTKFITLTNHFPYDLDEEDRTLAPYESSSKTLNQFFPTVRYMDESIEDFFDMLKAEDLYESSIIVIMGDHNGITANQYKELAPYLNKEEITPYDDIQLQRVPFLIHIPGHKDGETISQIAGQIDVKPTLLHILGIDTSNDIYFGNDLFHDDRKSFIALRNGDFISDDYIYTNEVCYDRETGERLNKEGEIGWDESLCEPIVEQVKAELSLSDNIIYGDLFRFNNFKKK